MDCSRQAGHWTALPGRVRSGLPDDVSVTTASPDLSVEGFGAGGERWTLTAQASGSRLRTLVEVVEPGGRRWVAGSGGRALAAGRRVATFAGRSGDGARLLIIRVADDVDAVVALLGDGTREDLSLHGDPEVLGARVAVLVHPADRELVSLRIYDANGTELAESLSTP